MIDDPATMEELLQERQRELDASEERFRNVINRTSDSIVVVNSEGIVLFVNPAAESLFCRPAGELLRHFFGFPTEAGEITEIDVVQPNGVTATAEMRVVGTEWDGEPACLASLRDISDRKRAEEERAELLIEQAARKAAEDAERRSAFLASWSSVLASSLDCDVVLKGAVELAVPEIADWCAIDLIEESRGVRRVAAAHADPIKSDLINKLGDQYDHDPDSQRVLATALRSGEPLFYPSVTRAQLTDLAFDGNHLRLLQQTGAKSIMVLPMALHDRNLGFVTFAITESEHRFLSLPFATDLAHRVATAIENCHLYHSTQEAHRLKDEFLATISHELRTPITSIMGWAKVLRTGKPTADVSEKALETIERNAKMQNRIINDILDISRIVTGKLALKLEPVPLPVVVLAALESVRLAADAKGIVLETNFEPMDCIVRGDPDRLQQVVWNLLQNAVKFTPEAGRVMIRIDADDIHARIVVADNGRGIKSDFLPLVFDRFRQADGSSTRLHDGLGLGLSISRQLVEAHGGTISAFSEGEGKGAQFLVELPIANTTQSGLADDKFE